MKKLFLFSIAASLLAFGAACEDSGGPVDERADEMGDVAEDRAESQSEARGEGPLDNELAGEIAEERAELATDVGADPEETMGKPANTAAERFAEDPELDEAADDLEIGEEPE